MARKHHQQNSQRKTRRWGWPVLLLLLAVLLFTQFDVTLKPDSYLSGYFERRIQPHIEQLLYELGIPPEEVFPPAEPHTLPAEFLASESARVLRAIDGDTIEVMLRGEVLSVRYIGINAPERNEPCYEEAWRANIALVGGKTVTLVKDVSEVDHHGRLLRYVHVGDTFVNRELVARGYAEAVLYEPDARHYAEFRRLERAAAEEGLACHPSGIFQDDHSEG